MLEDLPYAGGLGHDHRQFVLEDDGDVVRRSQGLDDLGHQVVEANRNERLQHPPDARILQHPFEQTTQTVDSIHQQSHLIPALAVELVRVIR